MKKYYLNQNNDIILKKVEYIYNLIFMKKGFTLIELLIVIAILAILAGIVIVALNPAELLKQARDGKRIGDLDNLVAALNLYLTDVNSPNLCSSGSGCLAGGVCTATTTLKIFNDNSGGSPVVCGIASSTTVINGHGWVDVDFTAVSGGSPIAMLPLDPLNSSPYLYAYKATTSPNSAFEIDARLESSKQRGLMANDGGDRNTCSSYTEETCWYEKGTKSGLNL